MTENCPVCDDAFSGDEEESAVEQVASHMVAESRTDPRHRQWVTANTDGGGVAEIEQQLAD